jgi:uncharacterized membrane protein YbaN (DUF454 family)
MPKKYKIIFLQTAGFLLFVLGVISLFLPFLQGIIFIICGLYLMSLSNPKYEKLFNESLSKFPRLHRMYIRFHNKIKEWLL